MCQQKTCGIMSVDACRSTDVLVLCLCACIVLDVCVVTFGVFMTFSLA